MQNRSIVLTLPECCNQDTSAGIWKSQIPKIRKLRAGDSLVVSCARLKTIDGAGEALIVELARLAVMGGFDISFDDPGGIADRTLSRFPADRFALSPEGKRVRKTRLAEQLGRATCEMIGNAVEHLAFLGETTVSFLRLMVRPSRFRWRDMWLNYERAGIDALPIVMLIGFLLGLILAFMSAATVQQFGVTVYVADLISIGLFRELGPIITAIVLAGRSGSAFAAEIGTMKVNEEIDALTTFGLAPVPFLVLPKIVAATLVMPILTVFAVFAGLFGGGLVLQSMDVPLVVYWTRVFDAASLRNILFCVCKSAVFGFLAGMIGCSEGLRTGRTADAVGRAATAAVVGSLIMITVVDGAFAIMAFFAGV